MEEIESQLKELILDEEFTSLQNLASEEVNLMDILGVAHKELQHSNFLAWLFNPNESHNLGDFPIKEFIKIYFRENKFQDLGLKTPLSVFDFINLDFEDLEIRREYKNIDLILLSESNKFCIVIENKIYSKENKGQLEKYRKLIEKEYQSFNHKIYIFLSLFEQNISDEEQNYYIQLTYLHIVKLIKQIIERKSLKNKGQFVFEQYLQTLETMLNQNEQIEEIAQNLYKKYKPAFDLIFKYAETGANALFNNNLEKLVINEQKLRLFKNSGKTYIRFHPKFLIELIPEMKKAKWIPLEFQLETNHIFHFEFQIRKDNIKFGLYIGSGDQDIREKIYQIYLKHQDFFSRVAVRKDLSPKWHLSFQKLIISKNEHEKYLENEDFDINQLIEKRFRNVVEKDISKMERIFKEELNLL